MTLRRVNLGTRVMIAFSRPTAASIREREREIRLLRAYVKAPGRTNAERLLKTRLALYNAWRTAGNSWPVNNAQYIRNLRGAKPDAFWTNVQRTAIRHAAMKAASPREKERLLKEFRSTAEYKQAMKESNRLMAKFSR